MRRYAPWLVVVSLAWGIYYLRENKSFNRAKQSREVEDLLHSVMNPESEGLNNAETIVHRVYEYSGHTWVEPTEETKLIAVDVELRKYRLGLDLDDIEIIDGETNESYGSWPDIARLKPDGSLANNPDEAMLPEGLGPIRVLLIYQFPKASNTIKLGYWGQVLTRNPIQIAGEGLQIPKPARQKEF